MHEGMICCTLDSLHTAGSARPVGGKEHCSRWSWLTVLTRQHTMLPRCSTRQLPDTGRLHGIPEVSPWPLPTLLAIQLMEPAMMSCAWDFLQACLPPCKARVSCRCEMLLRGCDRVARHRAPMHASMLCGSCKRSYACKACQGKPAGRCACVCCSVAEASAETLREMNPLVRIAALPGGVAEEPDTEFLGGFDVVLLVQAPLHMQLAYDKACTDTNTAFFTACSRGTISYFFENLHVHEWTPMVSRLAAWLFYRVPLHMPHPWSQPWIMPGGGCWVAPTLNTHTHKMLCLCCSQCLVPSAGCPEWSPSAKEPGILHAPRVCLTTPMEEAEPAIYTQAGLCSQR